MMVALPKPDNRITLPLDTIIQGDCLEVMRGLPDCSVDAVVTDPPYGLGEVKDIAGLLTAWLHDEDDKPYTGKKGFMGKEWDYGVPGPRYWREVYRVLKPGAHILCFSGTRTVDLMMVALRLAGFECRDVLEWLYGSGFPKSLDVSKAIDKMQGAEREVIGPRVRLGDKQSYPTYGGSDIFRGNVSHETGNITAPTTPEAKRYSGYGTGLKPSHEPIILARKPLSESSIAANVLKWGTGGLAIDKCRVAAPDGVPEFITDGSLPRTTYEGGAAVGGGSKRTGGMSTQGRFPSNLLLSHSVFCVPQGTKRVRGSNWCDSDNDRPNSQLFGRDKQRVSGHYTDPDGYEEVEDYLCDESCPILQLDLQSGVLHARGNKKPSIRGGGMYGHKPFIGDAGPGDTGGASRYFQCFSPDTDELDQIVPFKYSSKASRRERNAGCEGMSYHSPGECTDRKDGSAGLNNPRAGAGRTGGAYNDHPTCKPVTLMRWLIRLCTPPDGIVLDPFFGSGTTGVACVYEKVHFIGIDAEPHYCEIARARIAHAYQEVV